jgi:hypothetical protein
MAPASLACRVIIALGPAGSSGGFGPRVSHRADRQARSASVRRANDLKDIQRHFLYIGFSGNRTNSIPAAGYRSSLVPLVW